MLPVNIITIFLINNRGHQFGVPQSQSRLQHIQADTLWWYGIGEIPSMEGALPQCLLGCRRSPIAMSCYHLGSIATKPRWRGIPPSLPHCRTMITNDKKCCIRSFNMQGYYLINLSKGCVSLRPQFDALKAFWVGVVLIKTTLALTNTEKSTTFYFTKPLTGDAKTHPDRWQWLLPSSPTLSITCHSKSNSLALHAWHYYMLHAILASQSHRGNNAMCDCKARIAILAAPGEKNTPLHPKTCAKNTISHNGISVIVTKHVLDKEGCCHLWQQDSYPLPKKPQVGRSIFYMQGEFSGGADLSACTTMKIKNWQHVACILNHHSPFPSWEQCTRWQGHCLCHQWHVPPLL